MVEYALDAIENRRHSLILEPRGFAKSTWVDTILLSWLIARNPGLRVGLFSKSATHAFGFSSAIRRTFERDQRFREVFGHQTGDVKWTDAEWMVRDSPLVRSKDVNCFAQGIGGQIVSKRFDLILCDDILDENNTANPEQMESNRKWFWQTLYPCLAPGGTIIVIGTRWADGDLYGDLMETQEKGGKEWPYLLRSALIVDKTEPSGFRSLWPELFDVPYLMSMRRNMGLAMFACAMLNDITGLMEGNVFDPRDFQYFQTLPPDKKYTVRIGVDLASSVRESADYTARVTTAEDEDGNFYVLSFYRDRIERGHAKFVYDGWSAYPNVAAVIIEKQQYQSTLIQDVMKDYPRIPVQGRQTDTDKKTRARAVAAKYEAHRVWHHTSLKESDFEIELASFDRGHDDLVDSLGFSFDLTGSEFSFGFSRV